MFKFVDFNVKFWKILTKNDKCWEFLDQCSTKSTIELKYQQSNSKFRAFWAQSFTLFNLKIFKSQTFNDFQVLDWCWAAQETQNFNYSLIIWQNLYLKQALTSFNDLIFISFWDLLKLLKNSWKFLEVLESLLFWSKLFFESWQIQCNLCWSRSWK